MNPRGGFDVFCELGPIFQTSTVYSIVPRRNVVSDVYRFQVTYFIILLLASWCAFWLKYYILTISLSLITTSSCWISWMCSTFYYYLYH